METHRFDRYEPTDVRGHNPDRISTLIGIGVILAVVAIIIMLILVAFAKSGGDHVAGI